MNIIKNYLLTFKVDMIDSFRRSISKRNYEKAVKKAHLLADQYDRKYYVINHGLNWVVLCRMDIIQGKKTGLFKKNTTFADLHKLAAKIVKPHKSTENE